MDPSAAPAPLVVDARGIALTLGVSERQISRLDAGGKIPAAIALGRCRRWSLAEVKEWLAAGGPPRSRWNLGSGVGGPRRTGQSV